MCACAEREEMEREKDQIINDREAEIEQLEKKMEDMSQEFADMLKVRGLSRRFRAKLHNWP